jgi:acyl-CoA thioesterase I
LNTQIEQLANQINTSESPVIVVDQFTDFDPRQGQDTYDGCHPSEAGENKMADRWFAALEKLLPKFQEQ